MKKSDDFDKLFRFDDNHGKLFDFPDNKSNIIKYNVDTIQEICDTLIVETGYMPSMTYDCIKRYIGGNNRINRLLYSHISAVIFGLTDSECDAFSHNAEVLLEYVMSERVGQPVIDIVVRIYDHGELAIRQRSMFVKEKVAEHAKLLDNLKTTSEKLEKDIEEANNTINHSQKDYITVFGVFSAIIITFVGGFSFSAAVLENMASVSLFRLIITVCILALVLFNSIYFLLITALRINKIKQDFDLKLFGLSIPSFLNVVILAIMGITGIVYFNA